MNDWWPSLFNVRFQLYAKAIAPFCILVLGYFSYRLLQARWTKQRSFVAHLLLTTLGPPCLLLALGLTLSRVSNQLATQGFLPWPKSAMGDLPEKLLILGICLLALVRFFEQLLRKLWVELTPKNYAKPRLLSAVIYFFYFCSTLFFFYGVVYLTKRPIARHLTTLGSIILAWSLVIVVNYITQMIGKSWIKFFYQEERLVGHALLKGSMLPFQCLLLAWVLLFSLGPLELTHKISAKGLLILAACWALYRSASLLEKELLYGETIERVKDKTTVQAVTNVIRLFLLILLTLSLLIQLGADATTILSLASAATLALSLAGREIIANYLSGFAIYIEGNFRVGDWIYSVDQKIEGTIEYIGLRTTAIRTFDKRLLYVPNAFFSKESIVNASKMTNRRILKDIPIGWIQETELLDKVIQAIRSMVYNHPGIDKGQPPMVHLIGIEERALKIRIYAFTRTKHWHTSLNVQENLLRNIQEILLFHTGAQPTHLIKLLSTAEKPSTMWQESDMLDIPPS